MLVLAHITCVTLGRSLSLSRVYNAKSNACLVGLV